MQEIQFRFHYHNLNDRKDGVYSRYNLGLNMKLFNIGGTLKCIIATENRRHYTNIR